MDDLDLRSERAARNQSLFREVNERIAELSARFADDLKAHPFICECLDQNCAGSLNLTRDEYERLRASGTRFFVLHGHQDPTVENVVESLDGYLVVEKIGVAGQFPELMNPRKAEQAQ